MNNDFSKKIKIQSQNFLLNDNISLDFIRDQHKFICVYWIGIVTTQATQPNPNLEVGFGIVYMLELFIYF